MSVALSPLPTMIYDRALQCLELFQRRAEAETTLAVLRPFEERFWGWANQLKVFSKPHLSIDAQLNHDKFERLRRAISLLLDVLRDNLQLALDLSKTDDFRSLKVKSNASNPTSALEQLEVPLSGIKGSMERLERVAVIIIRATEASLVRRILAYSDQDRDESFERNVKLVLRYRFQDVLPEELRQLIYTSILHRYYRIQYERSHQEKEQPRWQVTSFNVQEPDDGPRPVSQQTTTPDQHDQHVEPPPQHNETRSEAPTQPLTVDTGILREEMKDLPSALPSHKSIYIAPVSETGEAWYPKAPKIKEGQSEAKCPICYRIHDADTFKGVKWRQHVGRDVRPYICLSAECSEKVLSFSDEKTWILHMRNVHSSLWIKHLPNRIWICPLPHDKIEEFSSEEDLLQNHLRTATHAKLSDQTRESIAHSSSVNRTRQVHICPICGDEHRPRNRQLDRNEERGDNPDFEAKLIGKEAPNNAAKPRVHFAVNNDTTYQTGAIENAEEDPDHTIGTMDNSSPEGIAHQRMEIYIGKHLKALAFFFVQNLLEEDDENTSSEVRARSIDSLDLASFSSFSDSAEIRFRNTSIDHDIASTEEDLDWSYVPSTALISEDDQFSKAVIRSGAFGPYADGAETAGLVAGVVALAGLFNTALECFEFVQLGRNFGNNFQTSQLKLDSARLRLSRWGKSLGLVEDIRDVASLQGHFGSEANVKHAEALLGQIVELFADFEHVSNRYKSRAVSQDGSLAVYDPQLDLEPAMVKLHNQMRQLAIGRQSRSGVRQKVKWALYEGKVFEHLIEDIMELVDSLVELFPAVHQIQRELCEKEVSIINEDRGEGLSMLKEIAELQDKLLGETIAKQEMASHIHTPDDTLVMDMAKVPTSITFAGDNHNGLLVGHHIERHFHAPANRPKTPEPACFVPYRRDPDFVDRAMLLDEIDKRLFAPASRVALVGLGGVGKSQLAIEHCYRTADRAPETWVLWAHASNTARLEQSFREIAEILKVRGRREHQADIFKLVHDWLRDERNGRWLLVVDNADDVGVLSARADNSQNPQTDGVASADNSGSMLHHHLSTYLPQSRHGSVLLTSRSRQAAIQVVEASDIILIEPMDATAAHTLLRKKLGDEATDEGTASSIDELAAALDHMPLALAQAAAYIRRRAPRCSVQKYLEEYKLSDRRATSLLNHAAGNLRRDESASNAILITWQISFDHIRSIRHSAANLLSLMSFFDRQGIPDNLLYGYDGADEDENGISFHDDLNTLQDFSFVTITNDPGIFEMQGLVQLAIRKWLESQDQLEKWREQFISNLCAELSYGEYGWERCQALFPHAKAAMTQRPCSRKSLEEWASLLRNAGRYAYNVGRLDEAEDMLVLSKDVSTDVLGEEDSITLDSMELVGLVIGSRGKFKDAEAIHRRVLAIRTKVLEPKHPDTLRSMSNIGLCLQQQGKNKEAEEMYRQTLATTRIVLGRYHLATLEIMSNLADVLDKERKFEEAEAMHREVLALKEKIMGDTHLSTLTAVHGLAGVLAKQGSYSESLALYDRACAGFLDAFGMDNLRTRRCYEDRSKAESLRQAQSSARADASESAHTTELASPSISAPQAQASDQSPHSFMSSLGEKSKESSKSAELQPLKKSDSEFGVKTIANPDNANMDIWFIPGLTGNRETTWTHDNGTFTPDLVRARFPSARILTYGYNTDVLGLWSNAGRDVLREHGMGLAYAISNSQPNEAKRPIFFVAHSLGGLITELALLICLERSEPHLQSIAFCAAGIVFMGTPHSGSSLTNWGYTVAKLLDRIWRIDKKLRSALKQRSDVLIGVEELFQAQLTADGALKHVKIFCFYETVPVDAVGYVVPRESATMSPHPSHGIDANHMDMAKFTGSDDAGFISLRSVLHEWSSRAEEMLIDDQERIVQIHKFL